MTKELMIKSTSVDTLLGQAIEKGATIDTLERLLTLRRELKGEQAKEAYDSDMAAFQSECPVIVKNKKGGATKGGEVAYRYAPLDVIVTQTKKLIKNHGFSYAINTILSDKGIKVICIVKHEAGHSENSEFEVPLTEGTMIMSKPQKVAATMTFAKRYAFCNAFGILTGDEDTDAKQEKTTTNFVKATTMIAKIKDMAALKDLKVKIKDSKKYTDEEKVIIGSTIETRLAELKKNDQTN